MKKLIYVFIVFMAFFSCKKKVLENNILIQHDGLDFVDCNCPSNEVDMEVIVGSPNAYAVFDETQYVAPQINPNNSDEIAFVSNPNADGNQTQIIIYNTVSHEKRVLIENMYVGTQLSWGKKDWILFISEFQMYKVKSNGDSLTPIGNGLWLSPVWNATGDKIVVGHRLNLITEPRTFVLNENGEVVNSINENWAHNDGGDWSHPDYYLRFDARNIYLMQLEANKVIKHIEPPYYFPENGTGQIGPIEKVNWLSYNKLLFEREGGLYTYDLITNKIQHIRCTCEARIFGKVSCSFENSKVVMARSKVFLLEGNQQYFVDNQLFSINPFTLEEEIIIP